MRISKHFIDRLKERTMYSDTETFFNGYTKQNEFSFKTKQILY